MTKFDMELRLRQAAAKLPEPEGSLTVVESQPAKRRRNPIVYVLAAVIVIALLIPAGIATSGQVKGFPGGGITAQALEEQGYRLPETLGEYCFPELIDQILIAPTEYSETEANSDPSYKWYYMELKKDAYDGLAFKLGSMDDELWRKCFGFDEQTGEWLEEKRTYESPADANWEENWWPENVEVLEYEGCKIYLYDLVQQGTYLDGSSYSYCDAEADWVDSQTGFVCSLSWVGCSRESDGTGVTYERPYQVVTREEMLEYVKTLIDAQR